MRICLDFSPAVHRRAGIGRYAQEQTAALLTIDADNEYVAFYNRPSEAQIAPPLDRLPHLTTNLSDKPWRMSVLLAHFTGISQDRLFPGVDLFHATDHLLPRFSQTKSVFTLFDLTFRFYAATHKPLNRWFLTLLTPRFLRIADAITAISESTRRDAVRLYGIDEAKITVIYPGVNALFRPASVEQATNIRRKYTLPEHFILSVGTLEPRKNLTALLDAYALLKRDGPHQDIRPLTSDLRPPPLVIVGKKGWLYQGLFHKLHELNLEGQVMFPGFVPDDDLPGLYSAADLFVYPSLYEGFGLPVLEAMACGTPVVTSNVSSLPEVVGDTQVTVDPHDARALARAIEWVLTDEGKRQEMRAKGLQQAARFMWERTARETLAVYRQVLGGRLGDHRH